MKAVDKAEILARTHLFKESSKESLSDLTEICLSKTLQKKDILFREGDDGHSIYVLISGSIQLYKIAPDGREIVIKLVKPGEMFAEAILFERSRYPVSAVALSTSHVYMLPRRQFSCLLEDQRFREDFLGMMMKKVRYLTNQINYLSSHDVEERLFLFLEEQFGRKESITVSISKKDIAAAIRTTPETLSRLLLRLKDEGKLSWEGKKIAVSPDVWDKLET
ncbi:Crp/Fnr family transcriptional regulator [Fibrobacterota bacterium]